MTVWRIRLRINVISDLHCFLKKNGSVDWLGFEPEALVPADYLVVAGDTGYANNERIIHDELRKRTNGMFKQVLTIKGNHSYWSMHDDISDEDDMSSNETIELVDGDVAIIGTTLWTNSCKMRELEMMNDYRYIPGFTPEKKLARFSEESKWLRSKWLEHKEAGRKVVAVTHHNPRGEFQLPEYSMQHSDVYTAYWVVNGELDDIKPDIWICGHIHEDFDGNVDGVRFVRHPIGYRWGMYRIFYEDHPEAKDSWYNKIIEV